MPTPTADEIELTREVLGLKSYSATETAIGGLVESQWAAQLIDNETWAQNNDEYIELSGTVILKPYVLLKKIRNRSRHRFGLTAVSGDGSNDALDNELTTGINSLMWF